jgi:hypothetical protein
MRPVLPSKKVLNFTHQGTRALMGPHIHLPLIVVI